MEKNQLIRRIAKKHGLYMSHVKEYFDIIFEEIIELIEEDECVRIKGFGTFTPFNVKGRINILNGKQCNIAPYRLMRFRCGVTVKERINKSCRGESGTEELAGEETAQDGTVQDEMQEDMEAEMDWTAEPEKLQEWLLQQSSKWNMEQDME